MTEITPPATRPHVRVLTAHDILGLVGPVELVDTIEAAVVAHNSNEVMTPTRHHLTARRATLLVMPVATSRDFGVKVVSISPDNLSDGLPRTKGLMILLDGDSGVVTTLMDAAALTCQRTGAVAAVAVKHLSETTLGDLGIVGCGVQGAWAAICAAAVRPIRKVFCVPRSETSFARFSATVGHFAPALTLERCASATELLRCTNVIILATTSNSPVLPEDEKALRGKLIVGIGSFAPHAQELPFAAFRSANRIIVDSPDAIDEVGDLINPIRAGLLSTDEVMGMSDLIAAPRIDPDSTRLFKSVGHAAYDLFVARVVDRVARSRCLGTEISL